MNKIITNKSLQPGQIKYLQVTYRHDENNFVVDFQKLNGSLTKHSTNNLDHSITVQSQRIDRNGFINQILSSIKSPEQTPVLNPKKIVIDFSSPNIAKPFHVGHLRSTIIGNFIANINEYFNNKVTRINYLGDWGTQFGLLQYGLKSKNINLEENQSNVMKTLYDVYVHANKLAASEESVQKQARKYFSDIEQGRASLGDWKKIRQITMQELEKVYQRLGIHFDEYHWESDYNGGNIMKLINLLEKNNIVKTDVTGMKFVTVNNRNVTILKSDNSTLYLSRDIAALLDKYKKYNFDKMLYVVDNAQTDHFKTVFEVVKQINKKCTDGCEHIKFGRIKGMSTRTGNVVFLNDILDEAKKKMYEQQMQSMNTRETAMNEETCDTLGISAVILNDLKQKRLKDYTFDWHRALQSEGDSAIKLQYLHCRLLSLEKHCGVAIPNECDPRYLPEEIVGNVTAELARFEHILCRTLEEYEACILVNYLFRLSKSVNRMFNELRVKNEIVDIAAQRLLVFHCARLVVKTSLELLGVRPLEEM
ncbi:hypothetical protein K1T71_004869 [Dendrolimus kikuchii]|uniref:Uncharacterized protein n=1 Tax=Dendrolimus kikuchii TaxID=765133 RepID=A0ACC1D6J8_9NEOP|nr:hypothetical protein K1T71_004869 [Dendrolimus kikuchii]